MHAKPTVSPASSSCDMSHTLMATIISDITASADVHSAKRSLQLRQVQSLKVFGALPLSLSLLLLTRAIATFCCCQSATRDAYAATVLTHNDAAPCLEPFRSLQRCGLMSFAWPFLSPGRCCVGFHLQRFDPGRTRAKRGLSPSSGTAWGFRLSAPLCLIKGTASGWHGVFSCYKAAGRDRMIIDRKGQNWAESRAALAASYPCGA